MHFAIRVAVTLLKPRFADGTVGHDEPWHRVPGSIQGGDFGQGIFRRAGSAHVGLRVAGETLIGVKARTKTGVRTLVYNLDFSESRLAIQEESSFVRCKTL
jgi:hypothetical protein